MSIFRRLGDAIGRAAAYEACRPDRISNIMADEFERLATLPKNAAYVDQLREMARRARENGKQERR